MAARGAAASRTGGVPVDDAAAEAKDASSEASWVTKGLVVLPGDDVTDAILQVADTARIGVGLSQSSDGSVTATKAGTLSFTPPSAFWVNTSQKRYVPAAGDTVIGVVSDRTAEFYRIKFGATGTAQLPVLAFQGASKRNRPELAVGALVYARVEMAHKDLEPQLTCMAPPGAAVVKDWMTGESVFGELKGGNVVNCSHGLALQLVDSASAVLTALGEAIPFEMAVGANGCVWANAGNTRDTAIVVNALRSSEFLTPAQQRALVKRLVRTRKGAA